MNIKLMKQSQVRCKLRAYNRHIRRLKEKCFGVNERLQHVRVSNRKLNCLRWYNNETKEHILKKLEICIGLKSLKHEFITEAIFENGARADIIDLTNGEIYEVMCSEEEDKCEEKVGSYPKDFRVVKIRG